MKAKYGYAIAIFPAFRAGDPIRGVASISIRLTPKLASFAGLHELCTGDEPQRRVRMGSQGRWNRTTGMGHPRSFGGWRLLPSTIRERP